MKVDGYEPKVACIPATAVVDDSRSHRPGLPNSQAEQEMSPRQRQAEFEHRMMKEADPSLKNGLEALIHDCLRGNNDANLVVVRLTLRAINSYEAAKNRLQWLQNDLMHP